MASYTGLTWMKPFFLSLYLCFVSPCAQQDQKPLHITEAAAHVKAVGTGVQPSALRSLLGRSEAISAPGHPSSL